MPPRIVDFSSGAFEFSDPARIPAFLFRRVKSRKVEFVLGKRTTGDR
jgi:hypothetical protein